MNKIIFPSVEEHLNGLKGFDMHAMQLSSGKFLCQQRDLQLPKIIIGDRFISTAVQYHSVLQQDWFYILIPKHNDGVYANGQEICSNQSLIFTENQEVLVQVPDNYYAFYIIITTDELAKYFNEEDIQQLKNITSQQYLVKNVFTQPENNQKKLCSLIENLLNKSDHLSFQAVIDNQESIIESLCKLLALSSALPKITNINMPTRLAIVNRALKHIQNNSALNITISELTKVSCCCVRSLEYAFKSVLNMTPKQYLIKRRFQLIHFTLKSNSNTSISEILKSFGIVNQGRFAQEYLKFYDEYPHQTYDRATL
jgi:AraC family ethanolamine operon transcriptional activator